MTVILKPGYAPVEQYVEQDEKVNNQGPWTDIYALGATLYKLVTGEKPIESMNRKIKDELKEPIEIDPSIPQYLNDAIMRAMAIERHLRFQTVEEFEAVLKQEIKVKSVKETIKRKKRIRLFGISAAALVVLAGGGIFLNRWDRQKEANTLPPANIEVWYLSDNETMSKALIDIKEEFCKNYPDVKIELVGLKSSEYKQKLEAAKSEGNMPELFQSDIIDTSNYEVRSLKSFLDDITLDNYYFLDKSREEILTENKLPLGFNIPVFYMNNTRCSYEGNIVNNLDDVIDGNGSVAILGDSKEFEKHFGKTSYTPAASEQFYGGEADLLFADTAVYFNIRSVLPGQYTILPIDSNEIEGTFENCWSMTSASNAEEKATERFLEFMLSDNAQDYYYIRNTNTAMPINKNALEVYKEVYQNDMESVLVNLDAYSFDLE